MPSSFATARSGWCEPPSARDISAIRTRGWGARYVLPGGTISFVARCRRPSGWARFGIRVMVVCAAVAFAAPASAATLTVTTTSDDATAGDGSCSLREAIIAANTPGTPGDCGSADALSNTIVLGPQTYSLTIKPTGGDDATTGDLNVNATAPPLTIMGAGIGKTTVSGASLGDRLLSIAAGANVTVEDLTISGGHAPDGARGTDAINMSSTPPTAGGTGQPGGES